MSIGRLQRGWQQFTENNKSCHHKKMVAVAFKKWSQQSWVDYGNFISDTRLPWQMVARWGTTVFRPGKFKVNKPILYIYYITEDTNWKYFSCNIFKNYYKSSSRVKNTLFARIRKKSRHNSGDRQLFLYARYIALVVSVPLIHIVRLQFYNKEKWCK